MPKHECHRHQLDFEWTETSSCDSEQILELLHFVFTAAFKDMAFRPNINYTFLNDFALSKLQIHSHKPLPIHSLVNTALKIFDDFSLWTDSDLILVNIIFPKFIIQTGTYRFGILNTAVLSTLITRAFHELTLLQILSNFHKT